LIVGISSSRRLGEKNRDNSKAEVAAITIYSLTFKDLRKRFSLQTSQYQSRLLFERLRNLPFWIWNIEEHKKQDIQTRGDCCFNHIIGLPTKNGLLKPLFDYQKLLHDSLFKQKHLWIKKATGLGSY
jgi:hypothetical protein